MVGHQELVAADSGAVARGRGEGGGDAALGDLDCPGLAQRDVSAGEGERHSRCGAGHTADDRTGAVAKNRADRPAGAADAQAGGAQLGVEAGALVDRAGQPGGNALGGVVGADRGGQRSGDSGERRRAGR